jgi:hypothetical protein
MGRFLACWYLLRLCRRCHRASCSCAAAPTHLLEGLQQLLPHDLEDLRHHSSCAFEPCLGRRHRAPKEVWQQPGGGAADLHGRHVALTRVAHSRCFSRSPSLAYLFVQVEAQQRRLAVGPFQDQLQSLQALRRVATAASVCFVVQLGAPPPADQPSCLTSRAYAQ